MKKLLIFVGSINEQDAMLKAAQEFCLDGIMSGACDTSVIHL